MPMRLDGRKMHDVLAEVHRRDLDPFGEYVVQFQERRLETVDRPLHLRQGGEPETMPFEYGQPAVVRRTFPRVGDDRFILDRDDAVPRIPFLQQPGDDAVDLPGLGRAGGEIFGPGQVLTAES